MVKARLLAVGALLFVVIAIGLGRSRSDRDALVLAAYTTPREVLNRSIIPAFVAEHRALTGRELEIRTSYQASGAQSRAVAEGLRADVVALSLAPDVTRLVEAGLVPETWDDGPRRGIVTRSIVVIAVREGNPKGIREWSDLARHDVEVLTPSPRTSGGAMWNVAAIYGAALRGHAGVPAHDEAAAIDLLARILARVRVMDKGGRESLVNFENGIGDAAITYENEVVGAVRAGKAIEYVVPHATLSIECPVAVVEADAKRHGALETARAFVEFLYRPASQAAFVEFGYRPVTPGVPSSFAAVADLFTIDDLGGWAHLRAHVFGDGGVFEQAMRGAGK